MIIKNDHFMFSATDNIIFQTLQNEHDLYEVYIFVLYYSALVAKSKHLIQTWMCALIYQWLIMSFMIFNSEAAKIKAFEEAKKQKKVEAALAIERAKLENEVSWFLLSIR